MALTSIDAACNLVDSTRVGIAKQLIAFDRQFNSWQRAAQLLRGAANAAVVPNLPALPRLSQINLDTYNRLAAACPQLNLPSVSSVSPGTLPGLSQLDALRTMVLGSYERLMEQAENTAVGALDQLERRLNGEIDKVMAAVSPVIGALTCACSATQNVQDALRDKQAQEIWQRINSQRPTLLDPDSTNNIGALNNLRAALDTAISG